MPKEILMLDAEQMKVIGKKYSCKFCREMFNSYKEAEQCETQHRVPVEIDITQIEYDREGKSRFPKSVFVKFNDNSGLKYYRR